jgi:hypothetical protein
MMLGSMNRRAQFQYLLALSVAPFNQPQTKCPECGCRYPDGEIAHLPTCSQHERWRRWMDRRANGKA